MSELPHPTKTVTKLAWAMAIAGCLPLTASTPNLEIMPAYQIPLRREKQDMAVQNFPGTETKDGLEYGNKVFRKDASSRCSILTASRCLGEFYQHAGTKHPQKFFSPGNPRFKNSSITPWSDQAVFPADPQEAPAHYYQKIQKMPDGQLRIDCRWQTENDQNLRETGIFLALPMDRMAGENILIDQKPHVIEDRNQFGTFVKHGDKAEIIAYPNHPSERFTVRIDTPYRLVGQTIQGKSMIVRIFPLGTLRTLSFRVDLTSGTGAVLRGKAYGNIDFQLLDHLSTADFSGRRNLLQNPSFESGAQFYGIWCGGAGSYPEAPVTLDENFWSIDTQTPYSGHRCMRLKAPVTMPTMSLATAAVPFEAGDYTISLYARSSQPCSLRLQALFNKNHSPWNSGGAFFNTTTEWKRYAFNVHSIQETGMCLLLQAKSLSGKEEAVHIDAIQIEKSPQATPFEPEDVASLLRGETVINTGTMPRLSLLFTSENGRKGTAEISILDWHDRSLFAQTIDWKDQTEHKLRFSSPPAPGLYRIKVDYGHHQHFHRFSVMHFRNGTDRHRNMFAFNYGGTMERLPLFEKICRRWQQIGIGADAYVAAPREIYKLMERYHIHPVNASMFHRQWKGDKIWYALYQHDAPFRGQNKETLLEDFRLSSPDWILTDAYRQKFRAAVGAYAARYPWIDTWTFSGEDEPKWPDWAGLGATEKDYETYIQLQIDFAKAVRNANPKAKVTTNPACNSSPEAGIKITERFLKALKGRVRYDYVGIHTYQTTPYPLDEQLRNFLDVVDRNGHKDVPVILPEGMHYGPYEIPRWRISSASWGPPTFWYFGTISYDLGWMEKRSAAWYARSYLVCLKYADRVKTATSGALHNFALDYELTPRMYQNTINTLATLLGNATFKEDISFAPGIRCFVFEDSQRRPVAAIWNENTSVDRGTADVPWYLMEACPVTCVDMGGRPFRLASSGGNLRFQATPFPLYLRGTADSLKQVADCLRRVVPENRQAFQPIRMSAKLHGVQAVSVTLQNMISRPHSEDFVINGKKQQISFASKEEKQLILPLKKEISSKAIQPLVIPLQQTGETSGSMHLNSFAVQYFQYQDWSAIPKIPLMNRTIHKVGTDTIDHRDFSGDFQLAYDQQHLHLRVTITDDHFFKDKLDSWNNDTLQIYLDTFADAPSKTTHGFDDNDYTFNIYPSADGKTARVWRELSPDPQLGLANNAPPDRSYEDNIPATFTRTDNGYVYDITFPAKFILPLALKPGTPFGFGLFVNDRDDATGVKSSLTLTPPGTGCFRKPHLWPQAILMPKDSQKQEH